MRYAKHVDPKTTPQREPLPGTSQVPNSAGGFSWEVSDWVRLERFLILGSENGTYYTSEHKLTRENVTALDKCLDEDFIRAINLITTISVQGRAVKNDPALFALAIATRHKDLPTRQYARAQISKVARTGTHLLHFVDMVNSTGGWGRGTTDAVARWYTERDEEELAYQLIKYPQRDKWSQRDVIRLCHPKADEVRSRMLGWVTAKEKVEWGDAQPAPEDAMSRLWARDKAMTLDCSKKEERAQLLKLVSEYRLPREALPTEALNYADVWEALLVDMPVTAMIRNLGKLTAVEVIKPLSAAEKRIVSVLGDVERLRRARLHPLQVLVALNTYQLGHGIKGSLKWTPVPRVIEALDGAFYSTFKTIEPSNKRTLLGIDVSASMGSPDLAGMPGISPRVGAAVMAMVSARCEPAYWFFGFCHRFVSLPITANMRLAEAIQIVYRSDFGGTDCALPMVHAQATKMDVDTFHVYTDNETWAGNMHPSVALKGYRQARGIPAKLVVVGMQSNGFTIADPNDRGMMDVVGFDTAAPSIIANFARDQQVQSSPEDIVD
jgi:60 kDa SS-A/Ro ribonucleoprotein